MGIFTQGIREVRGEESALHGGTETVGKQRIVVKERERERERDVRSHRPHADKQTETR